MAANYNKPKPFDPVWYRTNCFIRAHCRRCGHTLVTRVGDLASSNKISPETELQSLADRLRCSRCGSRPQVTVSRNRR